MYPVVLIIIDNGQVNWMVEKKSIHFSLQKIEYSYFDTKINIYTLIIAGLENKIMICMNSITIWFIQNILNQATRNLNWKIKVILLHEIPRWSVRKYNFWVDDNEVLESINGIQKNSKKIPTPFLWKGI